MQVELSTSELKGLALERGHPPKKVEACYALLHDTIPSHIKGTDRLKYHLEQQQAYTILKAMAYGTPIPDYPEIYNHDTTKEPSNVLRQTKPNLMKQVGRAVDTFIQKQREIAEQEEPDDQLILTEELDATKPAKRPAKATIQAESAIEVTGFSWDGFEPTQDEPEDEGFSW